MKPAPAGDSEDPGRHLERRMVDSGGIFRVKASDGHSSLRQLCSDMPTAGVRSLR